METEWWLYDQYNSTFLGVKMFQRWVDLAIWEKFLNKCAVRTIVELGTYTGAFSIFLLLQSIQRGIDFHTFDDKFREALDGPSAELVGLKRHFHQGDIFAEAEQAVVEAMQKRPVLLYCDDGYKYKEVITFFPHLASGDFLAVHDWGTEFTDLNIRPFEDRLEPIFGEECEELNSLTRFWRRL